MNNFTKFELVDKNPFQDYEYHIRTWKNLIFEAHDLVVNLRKQGQNVLRGLPKDYNAITKEIIYKDKSREYLTIQGKIQLLNRIKMTKRLITSNSGNITRAFSSWRLVDELYIPFQDVIDQLDDKKEEFELYDTVDQVAKSKLIEKREEFKETQRHFDSSLLHHILDGYDIWSMPQLKLFLDKHAHVDDFTIRDDNGHVIANRVIQHNELTEIYNALLLVDTARNKQGSHTKVRNDRLKRSIYKLHVKFQFSLETLKKVFKHLDIMDETIVYILRKSSAEFWRYKPPQWAKNVINDESE